MFPHDVGENPAARFVRTDIAGLQFYAYEAQDPLVGRVRPQPGERLQLVRDPANAHDENAIQVWLRNGRLMLGHVPRFVAHDLAPLIDQGEVLRAYAADPGDGSAWSATMLLVGDGIPDELHEKQLVHDAKRVPPDDPREVERRERAERNAASFRWMRQRRRKDAAAALALLLVGETPPLPVLPKHPPAKARGVVFAWWGHLPSCDGEPLLRTKTQWGEAGFRVKDRCQAFAWIDAGTRRRPRRYALFGSHQVTPKRVLTAAQIAAGYARDLR